LKNNYHLFPEMKTMAFQLERFVTLLQTTLSIDMMSANDLSMTLTSVTGLPSSGQIRALLTEGSNQEIVLATLPAHLDNSLDIQRKVEAVGGVQNNYQFGAGATVDFIYTAGNLTNDPRSMSAVGDLETLNTDGRVTRIPAGPEGASYFIVNGQPISAPGVNASFTNPTTSSNANSQYLTQLTITTDGTRQNPGFSNFLITNYVLNVIHGQNDPDQASKKTFIVFNADMEARGCGQRVALGSTIDAYGGGDAFASGDTVNFACGVTGSGDEGQFLYRGDLKELGSLAKDQIQSVAPKPSINTTTSSALTRNGTVPQTVSVNAPGTGNLPAGQWVVLDPGLIGSDAFKRMEAVKVSNVTSNSFDCVVTHDHPASVAVVGTVVLTLKGTAYQWGEQRDVVNLTQTDITGDSAYGDTSNTTFTRLSGQNWTADMLTGGPYSIGYIALMGDDVTSGPFAPPDSDPLKAWYPITGVADNSHLFINRLSQAGVSSYIGSVLQANPSKWTIKPGARILAFDGSDINANIVVLSPNNHAWAANDMLECVHSTSADCNGMVLRVTNYLVGGGYGSAYSVQNHGTAKWYAAFAVSLGSFVYGFSTLQSSCDVGLLLLNTQQCAIQLDPNTAFAGIIWGNAPAPGASQQVVNSGIFNNPNVGLEVNFLGTPSALGSDAVGKMRALEAPPGSPPGTVDPILYWTGSVQTNQTSGYDLIHRWWRDSTTWWDIALDTNTFFKILHYESNALQGTLTVPRFTTGTLGTHAIRTVTAGSTDLTLSDRLVLADASSGNVSVNLYPGYVLAGGTEVVVKRIDSSTYSVQVTVQGGGPIDNGSTVSLPAQYNWARFSADGTANAWHITG
jgi:hypothetical protein